ncbi:MAG: transglycosylase domain-containing protein [Deltaproteobacteria bacterium]|nr:transglycosylase domain-containing protein [Deltaproteobacteria bacterium]
MANPADGGFLYWLAKLYLFGACALVAVTIASLPAIYVAIASHAPDPPDLAAYRTEAALESKIYAPDGQVLSVLVRERRALVELPEVPPLLIKAFLAAEDRGFYQHAGVDWRGVIRAALANLKAGGVRQGGSTITQQVAKAYLSPERTIQRKLKELVLARRIESRYSKDEILYLYLNHIFLGSQAYGVKAAAKVYFGRALGELTPAQMATLAGLARAPSRYAPRANPAAALRRRNQVLKSMLEAGFLARPAHDAAVAEPLRVVSEEHAEPLPWTQASHFVEHVKRLIGERWGRDRLPRAGWSVSTTIDLPLQELAQQRVWTSLRELDKRQGYRGPIMRTHTQRQRRDLLRRADAIYALDQLVVDRPYAALIESVAAGAARGRIGSRRRITIPLSLMAWAAPYSRTDAENDRTISAAGEALRPGDVVWVVSPPRWLRRRDWGSRREAETSMALDQLPRVEGALYLYDHQSGYALAMVGGLDVDRSSFNRAVQACRQPGSVYKPVFYSLAMDSDKFSMATILQDKPYVPEPGEDWNPQNIHGTLDGRVTLHMSLVRSLNLPAIQLLNRVGAKETARWARRLGFTTPIHADRALALGASCVRVDELTRAFATFARGGTQMDPVYVRQIRSRNDEVLEDHTAPEDPVLGEGDRLDRLWAQSGTARPQVIDRRTAFLTARLLRDAVLHGIAARCQIVPAPTGGKGGTSSDTMDVWFSGFTSQWAATAWIGDDSYQRPLGEKEASYTTAIPMWANFMRDAVGKRPHKEVPATVPPGLKAAVIDFASGGPPKPGQKSVRIYYRPGSFQPGETPQPEG